MTPLTFVLLALAGGLGAVCRFLLEGAVRAWAQTSLPWGTIVVNVTGSLLLGLLGGLTVSGVLPESLHMIGGAGFLGGYTTFSAASYETVRLLQQRKYALSLLNGVGVLVICALAAGAGLWFGASI